MLSDHPDVSLLPSLPGTGVPASGIFRKKLLDSIAARYSVVTEVVDLGDETINILRVADPGVLVDAISPEDFRHDERLPYWSDLWSSSIALARWFRTSRWLNGRSVLELGCGVGLGGLAAAREGARVTMTDYEPDALAFAAANVLESLEPPFPDIRLLDWRDPGPLGQYDVIAGADIVYERRNFDPLLNLFRSALDHDGVVMLTEPGRGIGREFLRASEESGFAVRTHGIPVERRGSTVTVTCALLLRSPLPPGGEA
jgi:ETFB lysine methyltransferase